MGNLPEKIKISLSTSFAWLCGFIGTLHSGLVLLSQNKQDITAAVSFTIPADGWGTDSSVPDYPYYLDVNVAGLSATDIVDVNIAPASALTASAAEFLGTELAMQAAGLRVWLW